MVTLIGYTLSDPGVGTPDTVYNARAMSILELGSSNAPKYSFSLPEPMLIFDFVLTAPATQNHEYQFLVNGNPKGQYIWSSQINPSSNTRINFKELGLSLPAGVDIQVRTSQLTGTAAEPTAISIRLMGA